MTVDSEESLSESSKEKIFG